MGSGRRTQKRSSSCSSNSGDETLARTHVKHKRHFRDKSNKPEEFSWLFALTSLALLSPWPINEILNTVNEDSSMYNNFNEFGNNAMQHNKQRPGGIRYRDDGPWMQYPWNGQVNKTSSPVVMPLMAERPHPSHLTAPSRSMQMPTTSSDMPQSSRINDPSLEDFDLIDVLWRSDIADEKGASNMGPTEQFENDLQLLTEKSMVSHLSAEESSRYEDLAKTFFEDFYYPGIKNDRSSGFESIELKRNAPTPTDEDLDALLEDVTKETSELNRATQTVPDSVLEPVASSPLLNNVTLCDATVYPDSNVSDFLYSRNGATNSTPVELYNTTQVTGDDVTTWTQLSPRDVYPTRANFSFPPLPSNETDVVVSNGVLYDHTYQSENQVSQPRQHVYDPYYDSRTVSFSNDSSTTSTSSRDSSPTYKSEAENITPVSRYFGKLAPKQSDYRTDFKSSTRPSGPHTPSGSMGRGRRGRQSKDEQLAATNHLPVSAKDIAEMALADLQKLLKSEKLNEYQKNLIRKIRRRGKNKVAARTCRQRRHTGQHWTSSSQHSAENDFE